MAPTKVLNVGISQYHDSTRKLGVCACIGGSLAKNGVLRLPQAPVLLTPSWPSTRVTPIYNGFSSG